MILQKQLKQKCPCFNSTISVESVSLLSFGVFKCKKFLLPIIIYKLMRFLAILGFAAVAVNSSTIFKHDVRTPGCKNDGTHEDYKYEGKREKEIQSHRYKNRDSYRDKQRRENNSHNTRRSQDKQSKGHRDNQKEYGHQRVTPNNQQVNNNDMADQNGNFEREYRESHKADYPEAYNKRDYKPDYKPYQKPDYKNDQKNDDKEYYKNDDKEAQKDDDKKADYQGTGQDAGENSNYEKVTKIVKVIEKNKNDKKDTRIIESKQTEIHEGEGDNKKKINEKTVKATQVKQDSKTNKKVVKIVQIKESFNKNGKPEYQVDKRNYKYDPKEGKWKTQKEKTVKALQAKEEHKEDQKSVKAIQIKETIKSEDAKYLNDYNANDETKNENKDQKQGGNY